MREFHIPQPAKEKGFFGTDFELRLKNKLTQRAIAKECADWIRRKAHFRSNRTGAPMQQFACVKSSEGEAVYMPLHGFTAVDLGYQQGNAVSNIVNRMDEAVATRTFIELFDQIWKDTDKVADVTDLICDHIASVYQENSPERIYFLMLYSIFSEFLEDISEDVLPNERTGYQDSIIWQKLYISRTTPPPASSISSRHTTDASWPTVSGWARRLPPWRSSNTTSCATDRPRPVPEEAGRQLAHLQRQPEEQPTCQGSLQLRRALPH